MATSCCATARGHRRSYSVGGGHSVADDARADDPLAAVR